LLHLKLTSRILFVSVSVSVPVSVPVSVSVSVSASASFLGRSYEVRMANIGPPQAHYTGEDAGLPPPKDIEDEEAAREHRGLAEVSLCASAQELILITGRGIIAYFGFISFMVKLNLLLSLIALISLIPHFADASAGDVDSSFPDVLYLSSYAAKNYGAWVASSVLSILVIVLTGPVYRYLLKRQLTARERGADNYIEDPFEGQYSVDTQECVDKIDYDGSPPSYNNRVFRRTVSILIFISVLVLQGVINYYLQQSLRDSSSATAAVVISGVIMALNVTWRYLCKYLSRFELHLYRSELRRWDVVKLFLFKISNVMALYIAKHREIADNTNECALRIMADQFLILLVLDLTVMNLVEIAGPIMYSFVCQKRAESGSHGTNNYKPAFDLTDEYVELLYRQFIVGLGLFVVPILPLVACVGNMAEYWLDRYRMMRIAATPKRTNNTHSSLLVFFFFISGVCIAFMYPNGAIFVLRGKPDLRADQCRVFT
jgi:Calcium-activated chloride channel